MPKQKNKAGRSGKDAAAPPVGHLGAAPPASVGAPGRCCDLFVDVFRLRWDDEALYDPWHKHYDSLPFDARFLAFRKLATRTPGAVPRNLNWHTLCRRAHAMLVSE
jgi:hypothetical protein